eukprot:TRINITY_DN701_c0_g1_i5.p1 TRINITY_DN701_c0_g1~~TRINITY_DN701_c0_g1_i5.p1  ORF type:complete len:403 (+),score=81.72 TRINITY_DN701_c0_g1_i5:65-1273(+)
MAAEIVVSVKMLSVGLKKFEINIRRDMTVDDLKEAIAKEDERENGDQYRLTYDNKELKDGNVLLGDLKPALEEWSVFTVVLKPSEQVAASSPDDDMVGSAAVPVPSAPPLSASIVMEPLASSPVTVLRYVKVQQPDGNVIHITLRELDTIYNLKDRLLSETDTPISRQKLLYNGSILQDERELRTFGTQGQTPESPILVTMIVQQNQPLLRVGGSNDANDDESDMIDVVASNVGTNRVVRLRMSKYDTILDLKIKIRTEFYVEWNQRFMPSDMTMWLTDGILRRMQLDDDFESIQPYYEMGLQPLFTVVFSLSSDPEIDECECCSAGLIIGMCLGVPGLAVLIAGIVLLATDGYYSTIIILIANGGALLIVGLLTGCLIQGCCGLCSCEDDDVVHTPNDEVV